MTKKSNHKPPNQGALGHPKSHKGVPPNNSLMLEIEICPARKDIIVNEIWVGSSISCRANHREAAFTNGTSNDHN